jgi:hypothetical protein
MWPGARPVPANDGNPGPLNALLHQYGKSIDQDLNEMLLPPPQQGEDPEAQMAAQEQQMALEQHQQQLMQDAQQHQMKLGQGQQQMIHAHQKHQMAMHQPPFTRCGWMRRKGQDRSSRSPNRRPSSGRKRGPHEYVMPPPHMTDRT